MSNDFLLGARSGRIAADFTPPHRIGLFGFATLRTISVSEKFPYLVLGFSRSLTGCFDSPYAMAGWFNCRRDLDGLYLVCSTTRDRFTAQELIFETLTLCVRGRVLSILLCISAWHRKERILGPTRAACRLEVAVWNYVYFKLDLRMVVSTSIVFPRDSLGQRDLTRPGNPQGQGSGISGTPNLCTSLALFRRIASPIGQFSTMLPSTHA